MLSGYAEDFFYWFMIVQLGSAVVFTPAYLAGAIAEDKDRRRFDFLFATQLESQEIILGRYLARVANLLCLLLAGLPVLSFVQFWGGVDPDLVLAGSAGVVLTVISIASFTLYQSVRAAKTRDALVASYLFLIAYIGFSLLAQVLQRNGSLAKIDHNELAAADHPWHARTGVRRRQHSRRTRGTGRRNQCRRSPFKNDSRSASALHCFSRRGRPWLLGGIDLATPPLRLERVQTLTLDSDRTPPAGALDPSWRAPHALERALCRSWSVIQTRRPRACLADLLGFARCLATGTRI